MQRLFLLYSTRYLFRCFDELGVVLVDVLFQRVRRVVDERLNGATLLLQLDIAFAARRKAFRDWERTNSRSEARRAENSHSSASKSSATKCSRSIMVESQRGALSRSVAHFLLSSMTLIYDLQYRSLTYTILLTN